MLGLGVYGLDGDLSRYCAVLSILCGEVGDFPLCVCLVGLDCESVAWMGTGEISAEGRAESET